MRRRMHWVAAVAAMAMLALAHQPASANSTVHDCSFCHGIHGAPWSTLLKEPTIEILCLTCHGPGGPSALTAERHRRNVTCSTCHDPHADLENWLGGVNLKMVGTRQDDTGLAKIVNRSNQVKDVVFESRGVDAGEPSLHSFADNDEDGNGVFDGVCELCHSIRISKHISETGSSNAGRTCTTCHPHDQGFGD